MRGSASQTKGEEESDEALVERFLQGEDRAFELIYKRYGHQIANFVYRLLGDRLDLQDVVQETFVNAAQSMPRLRDRTRLRPWLFTIAVRQTHRLIGKRTRTRTLNKALVWNAPKPSSPNAGVSELENVLYVVKTLPPKLRVPWIVHRIEGETIRDTAVICEIPLTTLKRRMKKADALIKKRLDHDET